MVPPLWTASRCVRLLTRNYGLLQWQRSVCQVFEGIPQPYATMKRQVVPDAMRITRLAPGRKYCVLGELASKVGWKHADLIKRLEAKRKTTSAAYYATKKTLVQVKAKAAANVAADLQKVSA